MISGGIAAKNDTLTQCGLFGAYYVALLIGEAGLLGGVCAHYELGWATLHMGAAVVFCLVAVALFVRLAKEAARKPETLFLLIAPIALIGFALFMMAYAVPDEFTHINRVFDNRAGLDFIEIPAQLGIVSDYVELQAGFLTVFDYSLETGTDYCASAYSEINYLLPSIAVSIGHAFGVNGYVLIFVARLVNAVMYLGAGYWMLRRLPAGKTFALVFLLNPMLVQQQASCSADALCNIGVLCFLVQVISMRLDARRNLPFKDWLLLLAFLLIICVCKYAYVPLALAALILYPKIGRRWIRISLPFAVVGFAAAAFVLVFSVGYGAMLINVVDNFDPALYWAKLVETLAERTPILVWQFAGGNLGWPLDEPRISAMVFVPGAWIVYLLLLVAAFIASFDGKVTLHVWERIFFVALALVECLLIHTAAWSDLPDRAGPVTGVQGRYLFAPVLMTAFTLMPSKKFRPGSWPAWWFAAAMLALHAFVLAFVIRWFW